MTGRTLTTSHRSLPAFGARLVALLACLFGPLAAFAQDVDVEHDARIEGYLTDMAMPGSVALTWMLFAVLAVIGVSVLFKNAKRSHLD